MAEAEQALTATRLPPAHRFPRTARAYLLAAGAVDGLLLAQFLVLLLALEGHHALLGHVAALRRVTEVLHVVHQNSPEDHSWGGDRDSGGRH